MKNNRIFKVIISGIIAFVCLSIFCCVYYNIPTHTNSIDGATDYVWENNKFYIDATEGFSFGKTNNEGYFNNDDYVGQDIDVLVIGSSHMQGLPVMPENNISNILEEKTNLSVYNIGTTGHNIKVCVSNLDAALNKYKPKIVVIETNNITLSEKEASSIIDGSIKQLSSIEGGIVGFLQKNPFIRWSYTQIQSFMNNNDNDEVVDTKEYDESVTIKLIEYISEIASKYNTKVIMLYHPVVSINSNGEMDVLEDIDNVQSFNDVCAENSIYFIDMTDRYISEYKENNIVPTGFINTGVTTGHINKYGHEMMADELSKLIEVINK